MSKFTDAIQRNWPDYVIAPGAAADCTECGDLDPHNENDFDVANESRFSWAYCEGCGSTLGGDKSPAHAIHKEAFGPDAKWPDDVHHIEICVDCLMFHANGDEPKDWEG